MDHPNRLKELFEKYFSGVSTPEEEVRLARMIEDLPPETLSELLAFSWEKLGAAEPVIPARETNRILQRILGKLNEETNENPSIPAKEQQREELFIENTTVLDRTVQPDGSLLPDHADQTNLVVQPDRAIQPSEIIQPARVGKNINWWKYAAVAAGLFFLAAASYFYLPEKKTGVPVIGLLTPNDLVPGHQGAVLTLADGRQISLEDTGEGVVTRQGQTEVVNSDGKLQYRAQPESDGPLMYNTMRTPKGRQYQLTLSDGTAVWLNAASFITYPISFPGEERVVTVSGEAYFEVMPDKKRPFRVDIQGKGRVEVLGTHFNVNAYADEPVVKTTLLEGSVRVDNFQNHGHSVLRPGQQAQFGAELQVLDNVNTGEAVAWKNGYFTFSDAGIEAIMRQVTRWYDAEIIYEGNIRDERFSGSVPRSVAASKLLEVLELTRTVRFSIEDKKITVKPY